MKIIIVLLIVYTVVEAINLATKKFAFLNLKYIRSMDRYRCFKGENLVMSTQLSNKKLLPLTFIEVKEKIPVELEYETTDNLETSAVHNYHYSTMAVLPFQKITRRYNIRCGSRGRFSFSSLRISVGDVFGLKTYTMEMEDPVEILVYPSIHPLNELIVNYKNPMGDVSVKRWIIDDPNLIRGIREYTQDDPQSRIHWPSTARTGRLMVKNFDFTSSQKAIVLMNVETSKPFWVNIGGEKIEKAITITASLCSELIKHGIASGVYTNSDINGPYLNEPDFVYPSCTNGQMTRILELLAKITYSMHYTFEDLLAKTLRSSQSDCHYIIVTPIITEDMVMLLNALIAKGCMVSTVVLTNKNIDMLPKNINIYKSREEEAELEAI
jgi:Uncharacterized conserved protein (some members contain a von Willebrand factor type A (vWA) domain)